MINITNLLKNILVSIYYYFFPERCILCCREIDYRNRIRICINCHKKIPAKLNIISSDNVERCLKCSRILISEIKTCSACRNRTYLFKRNSSLWYYQDEIIQTIIHNYKFNKIKSASKFLSVELIDFYHNNYSGYAVIPVPCSRKRIIENGWDHMKIISDMISNNDIPVYSILKRKRGKEQKILSSEERLSNIQNRFFISKSFNTEILSTYPGILIIDDIFTTGSTVNECTKTLSHVNNNIHILTIALD